MVSSILWITSIVSIIGFVINIIVMLLVLSRGKKIYHFLFAFLLLIGAFEGIIEKEVGLSGMGHMMGLIHPEQGPNMMWNTKYGHMTDWDSWDGMMGRGMHGRWEDYQQYGGVPTADMPVTAEDAVQIAQTYLESYLPGSTIEHPDTFYGYYTIHVLKDGEIYGMLSVNGYNGQVWYHTWHGAFIQMKELT